MATYTLEPIWKKSIADVENWYHPERKLWFDRENGWRSGSARFESEEFPEIDLKNENYSIIVNEEFEDPDLEFDDGCWCTHNFCEGLSEEERQQIEEMSFDELEELGWRLEYIETHFTGPLMLTDENGNVWRGDNEG